MRLKGLLTAAERGEVAAIEGILASRFLFHRVDDSGLRPSPEDASWLASLPPGILQNVAARLQELSDSGFAGQRPEGASAEVAARALMELYALMTEELR